MADYRSIARPPKPNVNARAAEAHPQRTGAADEPLFPETTPTPPAHMVEEDAPPPPPAKEPPKTAVDAELRFWRRYGPTALTALMGAPVGERAETIEAWYALARRVRPVAEAYQALEEARSRHDSE